MMIFKIKILPSRNIVAILVLALFPVLSPTLALAKAPIAKTLLWEISGNGLSQPSYLFGTIHRGCAKRLTLSEKQKNAYERTQQLYLEIDLRIEETGKDYQLPGGKTIKDMITPLQYQEVEDYFGKEVLDSGLNKIRPSALSSQVSNRSFQKYHQRICKDVTSREAVLMESAQKRTVPIFALETSKERNTVDNNYLVPQEEVLSLLGAIATANAAARDLSVFLAVAKYHEIYFRQDIDAMDRLSPMDNNKRATIERNRLWIPKIRNAMKQKSTFFAFGAGHLGGEQGVISLLEKNGYVLRPIFDRNPNEAMVVTDRNYAAIASNYLESANRQAQDGDVLDAIEDYTKAIGILTKYGRDNDNSIVYAYLQRGALNKDNVGDFQGALYDFNKVIEVEPKGASYYLTRGLLKHEHLKDFQGALIDYNKAIAIEPKYYSTYRPRAKLKSEKLNDFRGALADYDTILTANPQDNNTLIDRGVLRYSKMNDRSGGIADLRRAALLARNNGDQEKLSKVLVVLGTIDVSEIP
jgi:uncharacterized protein